jgi:hypothetical protein
MKPANTPAFYRWLESVAQGKDQAAIHARDAMTTGLRLQVVDNTHVAVVPDAGRIARRRRK